MTNLDGVELIVIVVVWAVFVVPPVWALIDAVTRPQGSFDAVGQSRATWIVLLALGVICSPLGLVLGVFYLGSVRPKLRAVTTP